MCENVCRTKRNLIRPKSGIWRCYFCMFCRLGVGADLERESFVIVVHLLNRQSGAAYKKSDPVCRHVMSSG